VKVLMTGHAGYLGRVMKPVLEQSGHDVTGLDTLFYRACEFGEAVREPTADSPLDVRAVAPEQLDGHDALIHLAALSNDPLGNLRADLTYEINHEASVRLAELARNAGVSRFIFASSCSLYGVSGGEDFLTEEADFNPITPYGQSKVRVEAALSRLAGEDFSPTFMRNATVYGVSPALRADIVVNNLVGLAHTTGEIVLTSDGSPWRPLVHVEDVARAFKAVLEAPRDVVHNEAFNVGETEENYRVRDVAKLTVEAMPGSRVSIGQAAGPDPRNYRVDCSKLADRLPDARPQWSVPEGIVELREAFAEHNLTYEDFTKRYVRLERIRSLLDEERLDDSLRWQRSTAGP